jgi:MOSC domain-containing protein YiiM
MLTLKAKSNVGQSCPSGINRMKSGGYNVVPGSFAENLTTEGIDLILPVGTRLR